MKLIIEKHHAEAALRRLVSVVEKRNTISILSNVMIETGDGKIRLRVAGMDIEAIDTAQCEISEPGAVTVEAIKLYDIVRGFPAGAEIKIETSAEDPRLVVASGRSRFRLPILPVADFPILELPDWPMTITMPAKELADILAKSSYAASPNDPRYTFQGTYVHEHGGVLRSVAGMSFRVAYADSSVRAPEGFKALLPSRTVDEMRKRLDGHDGDITLCVSPSRVGLIDGDGVMTSKLIDGGYMDYARAVPPGEGSVMRIDADSLVAAVRGALLVAEGKTPAVRMSVTGGVVSVSGRNANSDATAEIDAQYDGPDIDFLTNGQVIMDMVAAFNADVLEATIFNDKTPTIWRKAGDDTALAVLAALRAGA